MRVSGRDKFTKFHFFIKLLVSLFKFLPQSFSKYMLLVFRHTTGILGIAARYIFVKSLAKECGDNVSIQPSVYIFNIEEISFGSNVSVHPMCYLEGAGGLIIGDNVSIAHGTSIMTTNHTWDDITIPIKYNKTVPSSVLIEDDVWIGCGVRILSGTVIGRRSIVAAGAVVNRDVTARSLVGGVPASLIKNI